MSDTPTTKADAYKEVLDAGEDVSLRKKVAAHLSKAPMTTDEITKKFPDRGKNSIRPRVNELLRMGCVRREGTRTNPSGNKAFVHHITSKGERYLRGEVDPEPTPPLSTIQGKVVDAARDYVRGDIDADVLEGIVAYHDRVKRRMDPDSQGLLE